MATNHISSITNSNTGVLQEGAMIAFEIIDARELAKRWKVPESWVRDYVRSRATDCIPHLQFGRYVRFEWRHPALMAWLERHRSCYQHKNGR